MIVHPSVQIVQCDFVRTVDVSLNGMMGTYRPGGGGVFSGVAAVIVKNGIANWYFQANWSKGNYSYPAFLRFDGVNFSWFSTDPLSRCSVNQTFDLIMYSPSGILYNDPARGLQNLPAGNLGNERNYIETEVFSIPSWPCVPATYHAMYTDGEHMLLEYIVSFPEDYYLYTRVGHIQNGAFVTESSGYVGIIPNGIDPIIINPPAGFAYGLHSGAYSYNTNSQLVGTDVNIGGGYSGLNVISCSINIGSNDCAGNGVMPSATFSEAYSFNNRAQEFVGTIFYNHYQSNICSNTDMQNVGAIFNRYGAVGLFTKDEYVELSGGLTYGAGYTVISCVYCEATGLVYYLYVNAAQHLCIDVAKPRVAIFLKTYATAKSIPNGLANFHRPVSILGAYKT